MKPEIKFPAQLTGTAAGSAVAAGADNDLLQLAGLIVAVLSALGPLLQFIQSLRAKKKSGPGADGPPLPLLIALIVAGLAAPGCAQFTTTQTDTSYENGKPTRAITTRAAARTLFESRSALANFKASQTDKTQAATVGSLHQESNGTNAVNALNAVAEILKAVQ